MKRTIAAAVAIGAGLAFFPAPAAQAATVACTVNLSAYTAPGSYDSITGVKNAMLAVSAKGGGTVCVDGMYNIRNFINLDWIPRSSNIAFVGTSSSSSGFTATANSPIFFQGNQTLRPEANGNTSSPLRGDYRYSSIFSHMKLVKPAGTIGRIFDFRTGAQVNGTFSNLEIDSSAAGTNGNQNEAFYFASHHQAHGNQFTNLRIQLRKVNGSSVVKVNPTNNFFNNNNFTSITAYKFDDNRSPMFEIRPVSGGVTNNVFRSITGQNAAGGFIHIYGQNGGGIYDSSNWDLVRGTGFRDSIRLGKGATTSSVTNFTLSGLGIVEQPYGKAALMAGRHLIALGAGTSGISVLGTTAATATGLVY